MQDDLTHIVVAKILGTEVDLMLGGIRFAVPPPFRRKPTHSGPTAPGLDGYQYPVWVDLQTEVTHGLGNDALRFLNQVRD